MEVFVQHLLIFIDQLQRNAGCSALVFVQHLLIFIKEYAPRYSSTACIRTASVDIYPESFFVGNPCGINVFVQHLLIFIRLKNSVSVNSGYVFVQHLLIFIVKEW